MDLQTRKIKFVQSFLSLESEAQISHLEQALKSLRNDTVEPMSIEELNERINQSETDFENGKFKSHSDLLMKYNGQVLKPYTSFQKKNLFNF